MNKKETIDKIKRLEEKVCLLETIPKFKIGDRVCVSDNIAHPDSKENRSVYTVGHIAKKITVSMVDGASPYCRIYYHLISPENTIVEGVYEGYIKKVEV